MAADLRVDQFVDGKSGLCLHHFQRVCIRYIHHLIQNQSKLIAAVVEMRRRLELIRQRDRKKNLKKEST